MTDEEVQAFEEGIANFVTNSISQYIDDLQKQNTAMFFNIQAQNQEMALDFTQVFWESMRAAASVDRITGVSGAGSGATSRSDSEGTFPGMLNSGLRTVEQAGISPGDAARIQNAANRTGQEITVVGSRANGTATATSDWDYIMSGNSAARHSAAGSLPRGTAGGEINSMGRETGIDIFTNYPNAPDYMRVNLDPTRPYVPFAP